MDLAQSIHARRVAFEKKITEQARRAEERKRNPTLTVAVYPVKPERGPDRLDEQLKALPREVFSRPQWKLLAKQICEKYGRSWEEVSSESRHAYLVKIRQEIWYRIRVDLGMSYPEIGKRFNKDHTTILHGVRRHAARLNLELSE